MKNKVLNRILYFIPPILVEGMIFFFSSQDGEESGRLSGGIVAKLTGYFFDVFKNGGNAIEYEKFCIDFESFIREMGHAGEHAALMAACFFTVSMLFKKWEGVKSFFKKLGIAFGATVVLAVTDELHQLLVPGRACELHDVLIDTCGALAMAALITLCWLLGTKRKNA